MQEWKLKVSEQLIQEERQAAAHARMAKEPAAKLASDCFRRPAFYGTGATAPKYKKGKER